MLPVETRNFASLLLYLASLENVILMKNNFWSLIWSSFNKIQGSLITFIGIFVSILLSRFPVKTKIPLDTFIIVVLILLLIKVITIQGEGKIQVFINRPIFGHEDILNKLANNDLKIVSRTVIKPIYKFFREQ